jgi:hypothetical protein
MLTAVTLSHDLSGGPVAAEEFVGAVRPHLERWFAAGVTYFQVHTNANLPRQGWHRTWNSGAEFGSWFSQVLRGIRGIVPSASYGFPGLAPGGTLPGQRADALEFLLGAENAAQEADWLGVNCFWTEASGALGATGLGLLEEHRRLFPDKLLIVTEFGNASRGVDPAEKARQYLDFHAAARRIEGVGAVFGYALSCVTPNPGLAWRVEGESVSPLVRELGKRST